MRIRIAAAMGLIAIVALELAALRLATDAWVDVTRHLTIATLAIATYLARYRRGDESAWWFGFALFGWAYFALVLDTMARWSASFGPNSVVSLPARSLLGLFMDWSEVRNTRALLDLWWNRYWILHSILILLVAALGGLSCWIAARRRGTPYRAPTRRAGLWDVDDESRGN
jgi:hypothetical protein